MGRTFLGQRGVVHHEQLRRKVWSGLLACELRVRPFSGQMLGALLPRTPGEIQKGDPKVMLVPIKGTL